MDPILAGTPFESLTVLRGIEGVARPTKAIAGNDKSQNPNVKSMSNDKVQNIWLWSLGLDLTFEFGPRSPPISLSLAGAVEGG
jgi:hypothetical protein